VDPWINGIQVMSENDILHVPYSLHTVYRKEAPKKHASMLSSMLNADVIKSSRITDSLHNVTILVAALVWISTSSLMVSTVCADKVQVHLGAKEASRFGEAEDIGRFLKKDKKAKKTKAPKKSKAPKAKSKTNAPSSPPTGCDCALNQSDFETRFTTVIGAGGGIIFICNSFTPGTTPALEFNGLVIGSPVTVRNCVGTPNFSLALTVGGLPIIMVPLPVTLGA
jgi:hypothetical protein